MSEKGWTPEAWRAFQKHHYPIRAEESRVVSSIGLHWCDCADNYHAQRIVACVNGCAGIPNPENLPEMIEDHRKAYETVYDELQSIKKIIPNPEGLGELVRAFKNLIERAGEGEGMDISSEEAALRACGIEVDGQPPDPPDDRITRHSY